MKKLSTVLGVLALALPAAAADPKPIVARACHDAGYDSGAIDHFMALIKKERAYQGPVDSDLLRTWGDEVRCYSARLDKVAALFKQQTGRKFVADNVCASGAPQQSYANGYAEGSSPESKCAPRL